MLRVLAVNPEKLIKKVAAYLKEAQLVKPPPWAAFVKTGVHKERPPADPDWWYVRCAAILRKVYLKGPIGVSRLRTEYGGRHRRGYRPPAFAKGSGSIIRKALQQLEAAGLITKEGKKGRIVTAKGRELLEEAAKVLLKG
ncbi:MAG: 30S ribosomal protein S19e [Thaumarchaeota archaeon]|jgi:small subunit ribosomal protein S19e|nr:30S ribosomal protein S19e [Candidatus Terraquivivens yellowstonensis]MCL7392790.1 30S ribosomal protein S19e [Candidatus Terraquivivens yellowstonensis]MCL7395719.1 30S ribosomal protein S19e [Candidatus Terraquivivens yellowstonensis]MCL7397555.1 30S ribosomal protein S19e [Candidatus Terraquivivens yellowstonensis]MCL7399582.1 30S ribosomal protein S19e [Candidatus Terraquivivens yellowstonensis]